MMTGYRGADPNVSVQDPLGEQALLARRAPSGAPAPPSHAPTRPPPLGRSPPSHRSSGGGPERLQ